MQSDIELTYRDRFTLNFSIFFAAVVGLLMALILFALFLTFHKVWVILGLILWFLSGALIFFDLSRPVEKDDWICFVIIPWFGLFLLIPWLGGKFDDLWWHYECWCRRKKEKA